MVRKSPPKTAATRAAHVADRPNWILGEAIDVQTSINGRRREYVVYLGPGMGPWTGELTEEDGRRAPSGLSLSLPDGQVVSAIAWLGAAPSKPPTVAAWSAIAAELSALLDDLDARDEADMALREALAEAEDAIGARIGAVRTLRGLTQSQLASAAGVAQAQISQWESGRVIPSAAALGALAAALGCTAGDLIDPD